MRQIKNFMEAKRPMWNCNECKCITMQCWKESEAFCGCGDNGWGGWDLQPWNKVYINRTSSEMTIKLFATTPEWEDYISFDMSTYSFTTSGIFNSEWGDALVEILDSSYQSAGVDSMRYTPFIIWTDGSFPVDWGVGTINTMAMSLVKAVLNDPTEANKQNLIDAIDAAIDMIMEQWDPSASFVTYDTTGSTISIIEHASTTALWEERPIASVVVTPGTETITATSSDTSLLTVRAEKIPDAPINFYTIYGEWLSAWTVTVTITWVDDPTASDSFSIDIWR